MHKRLALSSVAVLGLALSAAAHADVTPGFYVGASVGRATVEIDADGFGFDESDTGFKLFGGYAFNQYIALELAWFDGGSPTMGIAPNGSVDAELDGFIGSVVGQLPVSDTFTLFGKLGFASYDVQSTGRVGGTPVVSFKGSDEDLAYGVGAAMHFGRSFSLRAEYEMIDADDAEFNLLSLGGIYRF